MYASDYGEDVRRNLVAGNFITAPQYLHAQRIRRMVRDEFLSIFQKVDVFITPTTPMTATKIGSMKCEIEGKEEDLHDNIIRFTAPFNVIGAPVLALPCGFSNGGLPIGMQIVGDVWDESTIIQVGYAYQQLTDWHERRCEI